MGVNNLPTVVKQQHLGLNPRPLDCKADALPLCHYATQVNMVQYTNAVRACLVLNWYLAWYTERVKDLFMLFKQFFTAQCRASVVLAMGLCLCLSVCVCLSQVGVLLKRLNTGSHKQHHTIAQGLWFSEAKDLHEIRLGSPPMRAPYAGGVGQNRRLLTNNRLYLKNDTRQTHSFY